jgi:hypothetical protein
MKGEMLHLPMVLWVLAYCNGGLIFHFEQKWSSETLYPISPMNWHIHGISLPVSTADMCSTSVEDKATKG